MHYQISHTTTYHYSQAVSLQPHVVRLRPRSDGTQTLTSFSLLVSPSPQQQSQVIDLEGNNTSKIWFPPVPTPSLTVQVLSQVETHRTNPFDYLLEPWAIKLPIDYPSSLLLQLQPYLATQQGNFASPIDPVVTQMAQEICQQVNGVTDQFLTELNQQIYKTCQYTLRETGEPAPAGLTWTQQRGSCRDFTVLFMEACRVMGLAARFVSGYQEGDPDTSDRHLHAWAEVYLPGAGWRGFDPTQGLVVADRHIALAASAIPRYAAPITGLFNQIAGSPTQSTITYQLVIQGS